MTIEEFELINHKLDTIEIINRNIQNSLFNKLRVAEIVRVMPNGDRIVLIITGMHESPNGVHIEVI